MNFKFYTLLLLLLAVISPSIVDAHEPDHSYLYMRIYGEAIGGRVEVTGEDINQAFGLNINEELSQEELQTYLPRLQEYIKSNLRFSSGDTQYEIKFTEPEILPLDETIDFLRCHFDLVGVETMPEELDIEYNLSLIHI